jgi:hypothetical protein
MERVGRGGNAVNTWRVIVKFEKLQRVSELSIPVLRQYISNITRNVVKKRQCVHHSHMRRRPPTLLVKTNEENV